MDRKEPAGHGNAAQRFCTQNYEWLVTVSERVLKRRGFSGRGRDLAHDVRDKCERIPDDVWSVVRNQESYVARIIINEANDFCRENGHLVELTPMVLPSSSAQALDDAILVMEIRRKLSPIENLIVELHYFQGYSELETSRKLNIGYVALRKRIERLKTKLNALGSGNERHSRRDQRNRKFIERSI